MREEEKRPAPAACGRNGGKRRKRAMGRPTYFCHLLLTCCYPRKKLSCHFPFGSATFFSRLRTCRGERRSAHTVAAMYFSHGGSIRFAAGFVAGVLLFYTTARILPQESRDAAIMMMRKGNEDMAKLRRTQVSNSFTLSKMCLSGWRWCCHTTKCTAHRMSRLE